MSYHPQRNSHIRGKVKVVSDLPNYATKKELEHATYIDTYDLAAKKVCSFESWNWPTRHQ